MKKVGILTFCNANNFGAVLQAQALQDYLEKNYPVDVEFINLKFNKDKKNNNIVSNNSSNIFLKLKKKYTQYKFKKFKRNYLNISGNTFDGDDGINKSNLNYDYYIVGSDQVWNTDITHETKAFFLNWTDGKKVSYAASFGKDNINKVEDLWVKEELNKFDYISVREKLAKEYIEKNTDLSAQLVCDPVFLMDKNEWINTLKINTNKDKEKYIFVYYMESTPELIDAIEYISKKTGFKVKYLCGGTQKIENVKHLVKRGPKEFLEEICNSEIVISNSFHAIAFSIIFQKKFVVVSHSKWNSRLDSLLNVAGYENQYIKSLNQINGEYILSGENANINMAGLIKQSKNFIDNFLK